MKRKGGRDPWRLVGVTALFVAGAILLLLACFSKSPLATVLLGFAGVFLVGSAALDVKTGRIFLREKGSRTGPSPPTSALKDIFSSCKGRLARAASVVKESVAPLVGPFTSIYRGLSSSFGGKGSKGKTPSPRQRMIWFEDILAHPVEEAKRRIKAEGADLRALLEAERKGRNRESLKAWLRKEIESRKEVK